MNCSVNAGGNYSTVNKRILLVIAAPLVALLLAFFLLFELHSEEEDIGWSLDAWLNPYLAARQFLQGVGIEAETLEGLPVDAEFASAGTVVISQPDQVLTSSQLDRLMHWVESGGHLIVIAHAHEEPNPILEHFELEIRHDDEDCGCSADTGDPNSPAADTQANSETESDVATGKTLAQELREYNERLRRAQAGLEDEESREEEEQEIDPGDLTQLMFEGIDEQMQADLGTHGQLFHPSLGEPAEETGEEPVEAWAWTPLYYTGSDHGIHFMQFEVGDGLATVMVGQDVFANFSIGDFDHAFLLWTLASGEGRTLFLHGASSPALWRLAWQHYPQVVVAGLLLFGCGLWRRAPRFGPIGETRQSGRRDIDEHLRGCANYLWQEGAGEALVTPLRETSEEKARLLFAEFRELERSAKVKLLSQHSGLGEEQIDTALYGAAPDTTSALLEQVQTLKTLGEKL